VSKDLVKPAHKLSTPALKVFQVFQVFQAFQVFQDPTFQDQTAKMSTTADSLAYDFTKLWIDDPIIQALNEGKMRWGDILFTPEEEERDRLYREERRKQEAEEASERAALLAERAARDVERGYPKKTVSFAKGESLTSLYAEKPSYSAAPVERIVPEFPTGRRTLMAKNLPRDIDVNELRTIFAQYGPIRDIYIPKNMDRGSPYFGTIKGFAKIQFLHATDSAAAFEAQWGLLNIRTKNIILEPAAEDRGFCLISH